MKFTKTVEEKEKRKRRKLFRKSKPNGDRVIDSLHKHLGDMNLDESTNGEMVDEQATDVENKTNKKSIFDSNIDANKYSSDLIAFLLDNGLSVDKQNIRQLFSCIAASKLIILKSEKPLISERFIELFSDFIGAHFFKNEVKSGLDTFDDLFLDGYQFSKAIITANKKPNRINIVSLRNIKLNTLEQYFSNIIDYSLNPLLPCDIKNKHFSTVTELPNNMWFMVIPSNSSDIIPSGRIAESAITFELNIGEITPKDEIRHNEFKLSYENITNFLTEGYEEYFLKEKQWKKIDRIEEHLKQYSTFSLDNRLFRQLERYSSTYIMFGGDKYDAMDCMLSAKLLPVIALIDIDRTYSNEEGMLKLFERIIGLENLSRSKKLLKEIQESNRKK
jgi:hypothetical protein